MWFAFGRLPVIAQSAGADELILAASTLEDRPV